MCKRHSNGGTCGWIMGNLRIYYLEIKDLGPLSDVTWIGGNLGNQQNDQLTDFGGFSGETDVGMNLETPENAILTNIDGVDGKQPMNVVKLAGLKGSGLNCR